jgi:hypothetical protein
MNARTLLALLALCFITSVWAAPDLPEAPPGKADVTGGVKDTFKFGTSEAELVKSVPGLECGEPLADLWGKVDRYCMTSGKAMAGVGATIIFNLRGNKFVSVVLIIDRGNLRALFDELTRRHGQPSVVVPSVRDPERVVWLYEDRVLILEKSPPGAPEVSTLLVSGDESTLREARTLVAHSSGKGAFSQESLSVR